VGGSPYGVILGTRTYVDEIRTRYLKGKTPIDQPQLSRILKDNDKARVLREAAVALDFDLNESKKIEGVCSQKTG